MSTPDLNSIIYGEYDELTHEELQQLVFSLLDHLGLTARRVPVPKSVIGETRIIVKEHGE